MAIRRTRFLMVQFLAKCLSFIFLILSVVAIEAEIATNKNVALNQEQTPSTATTLILWQRQISDATFAMSQANYAKAEMDCDKAFESITQLGADGMRISATFILFGEIYQAENKFDLAEQAFLKAVASREKTVATNDPCLVSPLDRLANFYYFAEHRYDLATPISLRVLDIVEHSLPQNNSEVERRLLAVAVVYRMQGRFPEAECFYKQFLVLAEKSNDADLGDDWLAMANFYHEWGRSDRAELFCQRVLENAAGFTNSDSETCLKHAESLYNVAENYRAWEKWDRAEPLYRRSIEWIKKSPNAGDSDLARPMAGLAATLVGEGKTNDAVALYRQAFTMSQNCFGPKDVLVQTILKDFSTLLNNMNLSEESKSLYLANQWQILISGSQHARHINALASAEQMAIDAQDIARNFGATDARLGKTQIQLAEIYRQQNRTAQAEITYSQAITNYEKAVGTNSLDLVVPLEYEADFYYVSEVHYDKVISIYKRILGIVESQSDLHPLEIARWQRNLADVYHLQGKNELAETSYQAALTMAMSAPDSADDQVQYLQLLADFYQSKGRFKESELMRNRALSIRERAAELNPGNDEQIDVVTSLDSLAQMYLTQNRAEQAEALYTRSLQILKKIQGSQSSDLLPRLTGLAAALQAQKKYEAAENQYKLALEIMSANALKVSVILEKYAALLQDMNRIREAKVMLARADTMRDQNQP